MTRAKVASGGPSVELLHEPGAQTTRITLYPRTTPGDPTLRVPSTTRR